MKKNTLSFSLLITIGLLNIGNSFCQTNKTTAKSSANKAPTQASNQTLWTKTSLESGSNNIKSLLVDGSKIFVGISGPKGINLSTDNGASWNKVEGWYSDFGVC
jgi:CHASE3 domain sensor protein